MRLSTIVAPAVIAFVATASSIGAAIAAIGALCAGAFLVILRRIGGAEPATDCDEQGSAQG